MNAKRAARGGGLHPTLALLMEEEGVEINMTVVHLWWA